MATLTSALTLSSTDLTSDTLALTTSTTFTGSHTTGLSREEIKSVSKTMRITVLDGDADVPDIGAVGEGQYIDITDNHGLRRRYVFTRGDAGGVADGTIIVANSDIGASTTIAANFPELIGGIAVQLTDGDEQRDILETLRVVIDHANGHNGSITCSAVAGEADGPQSTTLTNAVTGESAMFTVDAANSTWVHLDNTFDAAATNSKVDHPIIFDASKYGAPATIYIKNTAAYHASNGRVFLYFDDLAGADVMEIRGQQFAYIPCNSASDLRAYTSTSGTIVEYMIVGTEA